MANDPNDNPRASRRAKILSIYDGSGNGGGRGVENGPAKTGGDPVSDQDKDKAKKPAPKPKREKVQGMDLILSDALVGATVHGMSGLPGVKCERVSPLEATISISANLFPDPNVFRGIGEFPGIRTWKITATFAVGVEDRIQWPPASIEAEDTRAGVAMILDPITQRHLLGVFVRRIDVLAGKKAGTIGSVSRVSPADRTVMDFVSRHGQESLADLLQAVARAMSTRKAENE